ncbi:hypothetical protein G7072_09280 [Nocardioides sp. HDW12B]|uniref:hypothetical protein n=1 Tax=Nocardioides sp. HDW12B TaxID=2714939 RepID=UPI001407A48F|nr:hypothetical protein [Nocardioides sp. HDW12B]QIK66518.1 hypothetical protein G7072_09280 [Nocardioides sp. HDW12B]
MSAATPSATPPADAPAGRPPAGLTLNLNPPTRLSVYVLCALGSIIVAYGSAKGWGWLGEAEIGAWSSIVALVNGLAAVNVRSK